MKMAQTTIKFTIRQDGTVSEEVMGIKGTQCLDLTSILEEKLGNVQWRKETPEYYQTLEQEENVTLQYDQNTN
tara:strand:+ start:508 stop:726 length:219 start_codon:yes stop_codon:yes gene_type:complete